jgi:hypothetical protein
MQEKFPLHWSTLRIPVTRGRFLAKKEPAGGVLHERQMMGRCAALNGLRMVAPRHVKPSCMSCDRSKRQPERTKTVGWQSEAHSTSFGAAGKTVDYAALIHPTTLNATGVRDPERHVGAPRL